MIRMAMVVLGDGVLSGGPARPGAAELQGTWEAVSLVVDGEKPTVANKELLKGQRIEFRGSQLLYLGRQATAGGGRRCGPTRPPRPVRST